MLQSLLSLSTRRDIRVETDPDRLRPIDADLQVPNTAKFAEVTGWQPEISFDTTMRDLLDYWRERIRAGHTFLTR
jgi:GDPmannose 4,6-dehydratase